MKRGECIVIVKYFVPVILLLMSACNFAPVPTDEFASQAPARALPRTGWKVMYGSAGTPNPAVIFDGNENTLWTSAANQNNEVYLRIDLGAVRTFDRLVLVGSAENYLRSYNLYLSNGDNWGEMIASNQQVTNPRHRAILGKTYAGRFLTIQAGYANPGKPWSVAELWLVDTALSTSGTRDPWLWPFAANSIWNTPLGQEARYVLPGHFAKFFGGTSRNADTEIFLKLKSSDPLRLVYGPPGWTNRCGGRDYPQRNPDGSLLQLHFPDSFILNSVTPNSTPNDVATLLQPDGQSLVAIEPLARCTIGGDIFGWVKNDTGYETLTGTGMYGAHYGSGLSGFGGSIRHGELTGSAPIRHVLKLNVPGDLLYFDAASPETKVNGVVLDGKGYRWPADRNDAGAPGNYKGSAVTKAAKMGALVAIPPSINLGALGLKTPAARKLAQTLQDYGAYIVDDAGRVERTAAGSAYNYEQMSFSVLEEAQGEFEEFYGYSFAQDASSTTGAGKDWFDDFGKLIAALSVVDNNSPTSVGGPGARRVSAVLPAFGLTDTQPPSTPTGLAVTTRDSSSVTLSWSSSTDNVRIMRYDIYNGATLIAKTYGKTSLRVAGFAPGTRLNLKVKAVDTGFNESAFGSALSTSTKDGYSETFEQGVGSWQLKPGVAVENGRLALDGWAVSSPASFYTGRTFTTPYVFRLSLNTLGQDNGGRARVWFHSSGANAYVLDMGGGSRNTIMLKKRLNGAETTLVTYALSYDINRNAATLELTLGSGKIVVKASGGSGNVTLFNVSDTSFSRGNIGLEAIGTKVYADDLSITLD